MHITSSVTQDTESQRRCRFRSRFRSGGAFQTRSSDRVANSRFYVLRSQHARIVGKLSHKHRRRKERNVEDDEDKKPQLTTQKNRFKRSFVPTPRLIFSSLLPTYYIYTFNIFAKYYLLNISSELRNAHFQPIFPLKIKFQIISLTQCKYL